MLKRLVFKILLNSSVILLLVFSNVHAALEIVDIVLPILTTDFYKEASPSGTALRKEYRNDELPTPFHPNTLVRIKVLIPPGATSMTKNATSNSWYGNGPGKQLIFGIFAEDPSTNFCGEGETNGCIPLNELKPYTGNSGLSLLRSDTSFNEAEKKEQPFYAHIIYYNPSDSNSFFFGSLNLDIIVRDSDLYNAWRTNRPWAGGTSNIDGIGETTGVTPKPDPVEDSCATEAHNETCYSLTSSVLHIPKAVVVDGALSNYCNIELIGFTLPTGALQFTFSKGSPCID